MELSGISGRLGRVKLSKQRSGNVVGRLAVMVLIVAVAVPLSSVTRDHCDGEAGCPRVTLTDGYEAPETVRLHAGGPASSEMHDRHEPSSQTCLGLGCPCHQPRLAAASQARLVLDFSPSAWVAPPPWQDLGVAREILHVPKHA